MATPVNTSDSSALKKALDDGVANILLSHLDFKENVWWTTRRLGLMTATALAGCAAQFAPIPLPAGRWLLGGLVLVFFIFNGLLNFMNYYVDRDYIFLTKVRLVHTRVPAARWR